MTSVHSLLRDWLPPTPVQTRKAFAGPCLAMTSHSREQQLLLRLLTMPMTVSQLANRARIPRRQCSQLLRTLARLGVVCCLTPDERRSRVYARASTVPPVLDVALYSWVCYRHRRAVLDALDAPRQPVGIKRVARLRNPGVRMSANNVRDVIRAFREHDLVVPVCVRGKAHQRFQLTPLGEQLREHLLLADTIPDDAPPAW